MGSKYIVHKLKLVADTSYHTEGNYGDEGKYTGHNHTEGNTIIKHFLYDGKSFPSNSQPSTVQNEYGIEIDFEPQKNADIVTSVKNKTYKAGGDYGYIPWDGHFESIDNVKIEMIPVIWEND